MYASLFDHVLRRLDAERAHRLATHALAARGRVGRTRAPHGVLRVEALGLTFPSPLGVAAGLDKEARAYGGLAALGFGFVEVGTITAHAQPGNPKPRVWRLPEDRALINAMGFPNPGAHAAAERLRRRGGGIVGVNVGKSRAVPLDSAAHDYRASVRALAPLADFVVLNVSSPNTQGLRDLQAVDQLAELLAAVEPELAGRPLLIKLAPDLGDAELDAIADFAVAHGVAGLVAVNTTIARDGLTDPPPHPGGVSGAPLAARALAVLRHLHARAAGDLVLVSAGGIETAADVLARIRAGATLVQAYTGFVYGGPAWPARVNAELAQLVRAAGASSVRELVGS
ncbi:MAG TPA: quinone-dependent dihydroorotate dehydrogenase [Solirubrobacter sp.]|nr:quinone-dependent dihydroorotate dehydrogenase [Solirubrobacter sp.]